jgi:hypothetical protein
VSTCVGFASLSASRNVRVPVDRGVSKRMRAHCVSALFMKIRCVVGGVQVGAPGWAGVEDPQGRSVAVGLGDGIWEGSRQSGNVFERELRRLSTPLEFPRTPWNIGGAVVYCCAVTFEVQ